MSLVVAVDVTLCIMMQKVQNLIFGGRDFCGQESALVEIVECNSIIDI